MPLLSSSFQLTDSKPSIPITLLGYEPFSYSFKIIRIEGGVVRQIVDDVKTGCSPRVMVYANELLEVLKIWRQANQFSESEDWFPHLQLNWGVCH